MATSLMMNGIGMTIKLQQTTDKNTPNREQITDSRGIPFTELWNITDG